MKTIKQWLRNSRKKSFFMLWLWNEVRRKREKRLYKKYGDEAFIRKTYTEKFGFAPDLEAPKRFTEKINWIKLNYRTALQTQCADKYTVREYVKKCGLEDILNPLYYVWDTVDDIDLAALPDSFVLKGAHGSGWNIIVKDKSTFKFKKWKPIMKSWLKQNIYYSGREWPYKNVKPHIICEKYIDTNGEDLRDYKIFCFDGKPLYIQVDGDRFVDHKRAFYDTDWIRQEFQLCGYAPDYTAPKPTQLEKMLEIAATLSAPFPFARIDLYHVGETVVFGEITFSPDGGFGKFTPDEYDCILGENLVLPEKEEQVL